VARYALNSTAALTYYNLTSFNLRVLSLLTNKERSDSIPQQLIDEKQQNKFSLMGNSLSDQQNKEYINFFGEDEEIKQLIKEITKKKIKKSNGTTKTKNYIKSN
jgi:hypothetical protein